MREFEIAIVGGGAIGLMTAWEASRRGRAVALIDRVQAGTEASWAGAGIISPASERTDPASMLQRVSQEIFPLLAGEILRETGIDIEFRRTGGIEVALTRTDAEHLRHLQEQRLAGGVQSQTLSLDDRQHYEPCLAPVEEAQWLSGYCQVRNPRLLRGLKERCQQLGVAFFENATIDRIQTSEGRVAYIQLADGETLSCDHLVCSAGAWSASLLSDQFGISIPLVPIQGQIVVYETREKFIHHILLEGKRYIVPREDNLVLVGATEDDVGFNKQVTAEGVSSLRKFAESLLPALAEQVVRFTWAGLRPGNDRGLPYLGRPSGWHNLWLATGHYRQGLQQSPGTAVLLADWLEGKPSFAAERDFSLNAGKQEGGLFLS